MTAFFIGAFIGVIIGSFLGSYLVRLFDVPNAMINGKFKPKNGATIDINNQQLNDKQNGKLRNLFRRGNRNV
jgi:hypothetical protein